MSSSAWTHLPLSCRSLNASLFFIPFSTWLRQSQNWKLCRRWKQRYAMVCSDALSGEAIQSMSIFSTMSCLPIVLFPRTRVNWSIPARSHSRWCSPTMVLCPTGTMVHSYFYSTSPNASSLCRKRLGPSLKAIMTLRQALWPLYHSYTPVLKNRNACFRATTQDYRAEALVPSSMGIISRKE